MAEQDFAQIESLQQPEDVRPIGRSKVLFLIIIALAVVAGGFVVGFVVGQDMGMQKATSADEARLIAQLKKQKQELTMLREKAKNRMPDVSTTQVGELTFYNELPQQSVDPEPMEIHGSPLKEKATEAKKPAQAEVTSSEVLLKQILEQELSQGNDKKSVHGVPSPSRVKSVEASGEYYLQLASFQRQSEAESFFPKLMKTGYTGVIKRVELPGLGTWYRVYAGSFTSKKAAEMAKKDVKTKLNITGLIVKGD